MIKSCPFCNPAIKEAVYAENDYFYAIYNIAPILPGHSMIIPKKHYSSIFKIPEEILKEFIIFASHITKFLENYYDSTGFDWSVQEGIHAGQSVTHVHWHIIPRKENDLSSPGAWYKELQKSQMQEIDNAKRKRLNTDEMRKIVDPLRKSYSTFK